MPYDSKMNQGGDFHKLMDRVCSELFIGGLWHARAANEFRKNALRGFGRWADAEACGDVKTRICLEKLLRDYCDYAPSIDTTDVDDAVTYMMNGANTLKGTLEMWHKRETEFIVVLNHAVAVSSDVNICIYKELVCLTEEVQCEAMRVGLCMKRLELAGYNGHDVGIVSMVLHEHFEKYPDDKYVNVNLG